ncbi:hypothetical protein [Sulfuricurvum sp.]|uniref:hypothetical protein n=1 Tax=Sulfuricurvum sp. TaxID=2025608 RepID=UPI0026387F93|nr:hypothetical protein [Sulfuricurvum sp.]MDD2782030.1 hypothetical protein [Sulfuricurvum sp.]
MDIGTIGVGAIIGSVIVVGSNLFIAQQNRKRDEIKERLEKLYLPMKRVLQKPNAMQNKYETLLELEKLYAEYEHLAAPMLIYVLDDIVDTYYSLLNDNLTESGIEEKMRAGSFTSYNEGSRNFNELMYDLYGIVDANTEELLRQYRGGFKLHALKFAQSFSSSPYSAKVHKKGYLGYRDDA